MDQLVCIKIIQLKGNYRIYDDLNVCFLPIYPNLLSKTNLVQATAVRKFHLPLPLCLPTTKTTIIHKLIGINKLYYKHICCRFNI